MATLLLALGTARAQAPDGESSPPGGWHLAFLGGVLTPLGDMTSTHQEGLAATVRLGWTSRIGLGLELAGEYSPLPRRSTGGLVRYESHFVTAGLLPRLTLGQGKDIRLWLGGGGGMAYERSRRIEGVQAETSTAYAPAAMGAAGLELHFLSGGGLGVVGSYMRTYGDLTYETLTITGGLVLAF